MDVKKTILKKGFEGSRILGFEEPTNSFGADPYLNPFSALAGRKIMVLNRSKTAVTVIPIRRKGIKRTQIMG
jgi:hypothetical protein